MTPRYGSPEYVAMVAEEERRAEEKLADLKTLAAYVDAYEYGRPWAGRPHAEQDAARAAIAKAEGPKVPAILSDTWRCDCGAAVKFGDDCPKGCNIPKEG